MRDAKEDHQHLDYLPEGIDPGFEVDDVAANDMAGVGEKCPAEERADIGLGAGSHDEGGHQAGQSQGI